MSEMTEDILREIRQKRKYVTLDGVRGVAQLAVLSDHFFLQMAPIQLRGAHLAVDLFFAMSGFVLASSYDNRLGVDVSPAAFMKKRLVRLYPLYFISIIVVALGVIAAFANDISVVWRPSSLMISVMLSLMFLPTPQSLTYTTPEFPMNYPTWSLFMELCVNVMYAVIRPLLSARVLMLILAASGLALSSAVIVHGDANIGADWATFAFAPPRVIFSFFLGVAIFRWDRAGKLPQIRLPAWAILMLVLLLFASGFTGLARTSFDLVAIFLLIPLLLIAGVQNQPKHLAKLFTLVGLTSYPIYVLQAPLQKYFGNVLGKIMGGDVAAGAPWTGLTILLVMALIGWTANRFYDVPLRQWLRRQHFAWRAGAAAARGA